MICNLFILEFNIYNYKLAIIPGDGIGPEVVAQGLKVLDAAGAKFGFKTQCRSI